MISLTDDQVYNLVVPRFLKTGMSKEDAKTVAAHLLRAERRGYSSHGLVRVPSILSAVKNSVGSGKKDRKSNLPGFVLIDGGGCAGIAAVDFGLRVAAEKARGGGGVVVSVTNYVGTTGCLGIYAAELCEQGFATLLVCHSEYGVAPTGSASAILGTNPITIGMPTSHFPFVADVATSAWSYGALKDAMLQKRRIPEGIVQTADGRPSTDPNDADNGSQLPMAGHKGYALGLGIELLCGPLMGGKAGKEAVAGSDSLVGFVVPVDVVRPKDLVLADVDRLFAEIQESPHAQGHSDIRIPGARAQLKERTTEQIQISPALHSQIESL